MAIEQRPRNKRKRWNNDSRRRKQVLSLFPIVEKTKSVVSSFSELNDSNNKNKGFVYSIALSFVEMSNYKISLVKSVFECKLPLVQLSQRTS